MVFTEALTEYLIDGLADGLAEFDEPDRPIPLAVDRYIALSAFQKAIRRRNEDLALRAATSLMVNGPKAIWRRLGIIAFEDIGVANIDAVGWVTVVIGCAKYSELGRSSKPMTDMSWGTARPCSLSARSTPNVTR